MKPALVLVVRGRWVPLYSVLIVIKGMPWDFMEINLKLAA